MSNETKCQVCGGGTVGVVWGVRVCGTCLGAWAAECVMPSDSTDLKAMEAAARGYLRTRHAALKAVSP